MMSHTCAPWMMRTYWSNCTHLMKTKMCTCWHLGFRRKWPIHCIFNINHTIDKPIQVTPSNLPLSNNVVEEAEVQNCDLYQDNGMESKESGPDFQ